MVTMAGRRKQPHRLLADCLQSVTIARLDANYERVAEALERIAEQGALVLGLRKDIDRHEDALEEIFPRLRNIEARHAEEDGAQKVKKEVFEEEKEKGRFWTRAKIELVQPGILLIFFFLWLLDKFGIFVWLAEQFHSMAK